MLKTLSTLCLAATLFVASAVTARADLAQVGPINLQNGYPLWWMDANGTQVEICLDAANCPLFDPAQPSPFSQQIGFGAEAFWWLAAADLVNPIGVGLFELAMEAAFLTETAAPGDQLPFVRLRARFDVAATGDYTITYPFGSLTVNVPVVADGINLTIDIPGAATDVPPFGGALITGIPPVDASAGTANGVSAFFRAVTPAPPAGFMGVSGAASTIDATGLVNGATVTVTGPAGAFGATNTLTNNGLWDVAGKLFIPGINVAPVANPDLKATAVATPVTINVVSNDQDTIAPGVNDHGINPKAVALGNDTTTLLNNAIGASLTRATAQGGTARINSDGTLTYTPAPTFSGVDSFAYVVQDTGGLVATASAIVTVEQLATQASFRPKLQKWDIGGTTSVVNLSTGTTTPTLFSNLMAAQEVPARTSSGQGDVSLILRPGVDAIPGTDDDEIDFILNYSGLTDVTQAHIHNGAVGANGPVNIFLCTNLPNAPVGGAAIPACPATGGTVTGTRTLADLQAAGAVTTFPELIAAIQAGGTYVNVHTAAVPSGEIRGQVGRNVVAVHSGSTTSAPVLGVVAVPALQAGQSVSNWSLPQKLQGLPSADRMITIQTSAGNTTTVPLRVR